MKAALGEQWKLLDLQKLDTRITQLQHRRTHLPQVAQLETLGAQHRTLSEDAVLAQVAVDDVEREITRAEADVQVVRDRAARDRQLLDAGQGSAKELTSLQHELQTLARRQSELEDVELEVMERREALRATAESTAARRDEVATTITRLEGERDEALAEIDADLREVASDRDAAVRGVQADLLALYEKLRTQLGSGAAPLIERRCGGCGLELNAGELARLKAAPEDDVQRCEECRRILVRTSESGL